MICAQALAGKKFSQEIGVDKVDKSLVSNFEILNLVPVQTSKENEDQNSNKSESGELRLKLFKMLIKFKNISVQPMR